MKFVNFKNCTYSPLTDFCNNSIDSARSSMLIQHYALKDVEGFDERMDDDIENISEEESELLEFYEVIFVNLARKHCQKGYKDEQEMYKAIDKEFKKIVKMLDIDKIEYKEKEPEEDKKYIDYNALIRELSEPWS